MAYDLEGQTIETTATGYLVNTDDWSKDLAKRIAELDGITLTERHWDVIDYLRDEYFNNNQNTPNTRAIIKAMSERWDAKVDQKTLYDLFPLDPSKQGGRIAGLPESRRKGGYERPAKSDAGRVDAASVAVRHAIEAVERVQDRRDLAPREPVVDGLGRTTDLNELHSAQNGQMLRQRGLAQPDDLLQIAHRPFAVNEIA